jgi:hypothetical protein
MTSRLPFEVSFRSRTAPPAEYARLTNCRLQLKNADLFKDKSYVNGNWVEAKSGKRFDIVGIIYVLFSHSFEAETF